MPGLTAGGEKRSPVESWSGAFLKLVFPPRCLCCSVVLPPPVDPPLCRSCLSTFSPAGLICPQCEQFYEQEKPCSCSTAALPVQGLFALSWYEGEWRRMLHRLKYEGRRQLARPLGRWLGTLLLKQGGWTLDLVIPVPLHRLREAERGFNQTLLIARYTAQVLRLPLLPLLIKSRSTHSQTGLSRQERLNNVAGTFTYNGPDTRGKTALLLDDIYTTGATIREAAAVLQRQGMKVFGAVTAYNRRLY